MQKLNPVSQIPCLDSIESLDVEFGDTVSVRVKLKDGLWTMRVFSRIACNTANSPDFQLVKVDQCISYAVSLKYFGITFWWLIRSLPRWPMRFVRNRQHVLSAYSTDRDIAVAYGNRRQMQSIT
jgi:hypothetical protein